LKAQLFPDTGQDRAFNAHAAVAATPQPRALA
jgi:hypothetical protein